MFVAEQRELWYRNGGYVTHSHWKRLKKDLRERIIQYLQGLPLNYDFEVNDLHYKLVHGAPTEEYKYFQKFHPTPTHFSVWKRWRFFEELHGDYILVFGHTPTIEYTFSGVMQLLNTKTIAPCGFGNSPSASASTAAAAIPIPPSMMRHMAGWPAFAWMT